VNDLIITLKPVNNLQSGFHFLTSVIEQLNSVEHLGFTGRPNTQENHPKKCYKAIFKGLNNLAEKPNKLQKIRFFNLSGSNNEQIDMIFSPLNKYLTSLRSIEF
jgi:hypothetical protein